MNPPKRRILLIDLNDPRRDTRVKILHSAGYVVDVSNDHEAATKLGGENDYDLVLIALHEKKFQDAVNYSNRLQSANIDLPILLLADTGVYVPKGTLSPHMEGGNPKHLIEEIARMLTGKPHVQEIPGADVSE